MCELFELFWKWGGWAMDSRVLDRISIIQFLPPYTATVLALENWRIFSPGREKNLLKFSGKISEPFNKVMISFKTIGLSSALLAKNTHAAEWTHLSLKLFFKTQRRFRRDLWYKTQATCYFNRRSRLPLTPQVCTGRLRSLDQFSISSMS